MISDGSLTIRLGFAWQIVFCLTALGSGAADAIIYYISPAGDDAWSGRLADAN